MGRYYYLLLLHQHLVESKEVSHFDPALSKKKMKREKAFLKAHKPFFVYLKSDDTHLDEHYFLRARVSEAFALGHTYDLHPEGISTPHSELAAKLMASDQFYIRLQKELGMVPKPTVKSDGDHPKGKWLGSKVDFAELCYALCDFVEVEGNKTSPKQMAECLSKALKVDIEAIHQNVLNLRKRQDRSKFLDALKSNLLTKIENTLE